METSFRHIEGGVTVLVEIKHNDTTGSVFATITDRQGYTTRYQMCYFPTWPLPFFWTAEQAEAFQQRTLLAWEHMQAFGPETAFPELDTVPGLRAYVIDMPFVESIPFLLFNRDLGERAPFPVRAPQPTPPAAQTEFGPAVRLEVADAITVPNAMLRGLLEGQAFPVSLALTMNGEPITLHGTFSTIAPTEQGA